MKTILLSILFNVLVDLPTVSGPIVEFVESHTFDEIGTYVVLGSLGIGLFWKVFKKILKVIFKISLVVLGILGITKLLK